MKGMVFTEFFDHVEAVMGPDMVDAIIDDCDLSTGGAYTAVGAYPFSELRDLLMALSQRSGVSPAVLLEGFGRRLAGSFLRGHAKYFDSASNLFDFLASIDGHVHIEVRKLYPDAELPSLAVSERSENRLVIDYRSQRGLESLAEGLIAATAEHYGEPVDLSMARDPADPGLVRLTLERRAA